MSAPEPPARPPTGIPRVDALAAKHNLELTDYIRAASEYVRTSHSCTTGQKKAAQIRLSDALARILAGELRVRLNTAGDIHPGERVFSGALRRARLDVSEFHDLDGLRLAVELKPVNLAVGRAIWNRFGDIRMTAVNVHLKFPFAVASGLLTVPTYEMSPAGTRKSTVHLITRAIDRFERAGSRATESDAAHLLEAVGIVVYDPDSEQLDSALPPTDSPLRWDNFVASMVRTYDARFGEAASPGPEDDSEPS